MPQVKAVSLWDPSYQLDDYSWAIGIQDDYGDRYCIRWGNAYMFNKKMLEAEKQEGTLEKCRELSRHVRFPIQVIHAGQGGLYTKGESYHSYCAQQHDYLLIPGASHSFEELSLLPQLFERTKDWFSQW